MEFTSLHKYIQNISTSGTNLTEYQLNIIGGSWTLKGQEKSPHNRVGLKKEKEKKEEMRRDQHP